ncbi:plasmid mobilization protein [Raoultibacter massiliensis]
MPCKNSARVRSRTVAFRLSEEQAKELDLRVKASGLTKQDYILAKLEG